MIGAASRNGIPFVLAGVAVAATLPACVAPRAAAEGGSVETRIVVKLARPSDDAEAIAAEARRRSGVAVTYAAAVSPSWHALRLRCASQGECDAAVDRLRAARAVYEAVESDGRKTRQPS